MKLSIHYKSGENLNYSEEETQRIVKEINYLKLLLFMSDNEKFKGGIFKILGREILAEDVHSVEVLI